MGIQHREAVVYLYSTWLYSDAPILHGLYAQSHCWEPFAVAGEESRYGRWPFPGALYIPRRERNALLGSIGPSLLAGPGYGAAVRARVEGEARRLLRLLRRMRASRAGAVEVEAALRGAARVLSVGAIKEVLEPEQARALLGHFVPDTVAREQVLFLYQPLCLPHYTKVEAAVLWHASRYVAARSPRLAQKEVRACVDRVAHHARFLLEPTHLAARGAMRALLEERAGGHGRSPQRLLAARRQVLRHNARAREASVRAAQTLLRAHVALGPATLEGRRTFMELVRFIQWMATWEELKHILVMDAVREVRRVMDRHQVPHTATLETLLAALAQRRSTRR